MTLPSARGSVAAETKFDMSNVSGSANSPGMVEITVDISGLTGAYYVGLRGSTTNADSFEATILEARLEG